jgi:hypothetical protein
MGEKKTPSAFISACEKFIYIEILKQKPASEKISTTIKGKKPVSSAPETLNKIDHEIIKSINDSINDLADEDGWAFLGELGSLILKKHPDFDPRNFGFSKLLPLIKSVKKFQVDERKTGNSNIKIVYVRIKRGRF